MTKEEIVRSIGSILAADGKIVRQEQQFFMKICKRLQISQKHASEILKDVKQGNQQIHVPDDPTEKQFLYKLLLQAACSDGTISPEEQDLLETFAVKIGMTITDVQHAVSAYVKEQTPQKTDTSEAESALQRRILRNKILIWKDTYKTRIDEELTDAFPSLEQHLKDAVSRHAVDMLKWRPKKFTRKILEPEILAWVTRHTEPLMNDAQHELTNIITHRDVSLGEMQAEGSSHPTDVVTPLVAIIAGIGTMVAGVVVSISTFLWFFTMINWPVLIGGIVVGEALSRLGVGKFTHINRQILSRFMKIFLPKIRDALIGNGYMYKKQEYPSLNKQLQESIEQTTQTLLQEVRS